MRALRRAMRMAASSSNHVDPSRRELLRTAALASAAAAVPSVISGCVRPADRPVSRSPRVVVVGAGIAGLHAAWILRQHGITAEIFEAGARTGGRMYSVPDLMVQGAVTELGGEFIDSVHTDMMQLVKTFNLPLIDLQDEPYTSMRDTYYFEGRRYNEADIVREITHVIERLRRDVAVLPTSLHRLAETPAAAFDAMSLESYLTSLGVSGWLRSFLDVAFVTENGLECGDQSALNFLTMVRADVSDGSFLQFGDSDERFKVRGGNQRIVDALASEMHPQIRTGHMLESIGMAGTQYVLTFRRDATSVDVSADIVLLALPFTLLRDVAINVPIPAEKQRAIDELRYGSNGKVVVSFDAPFWHANNDNGVIYTDLPMQLVWDNTALQNVAAAGLTFFNGGAMSRQIGRMTKEDAGRMLVEHLSTVWPTASEHPPGRIERFHWPTYRYSKGSYSSYGPGQWTQFFGRESTPVGRLFFAGEHCSENFKGYMNGAAETGRVAAERILSVYA